MTKFLRKARVASKRLLTVHVFEKGGPADFKGRDNFFYFLQSGAMDSTFNSAVVTALGFDEVRKLFLRISLSLP